MLMVERNRGTPMLELSYDAGMQRVKQRSMVTGMLGKPYLVLPLWLVLSEKEGHRKFITRFPILQSAFRQTKKYHWVWFTSLIVPEPILDQVALYIDLTVAPLCSPKQN